MRKILLSLVVLIVIGAIAFFTFAPGIVERSLNKVLKPAPYTVGERARKLHESLTVADLHADSLLWGRDLRADTDGVQVDIPKLQRGNVAIQAFTVVTKTPRGLNIEQNTDQTDNVYWLVFTQMQPFGNLSSLTKRAVYQANMLNDLASKSYDELIVVRTKKDLAAVLEKRANSKVVGGFLGIEGAHALDGNLDNIDVLFDAGFRMMAPTHFFDNDIAGSAHGISKAGLTDKGREMIRRMEAKKMIVDVAHASAATIEDVLKMATRPVVVSHTGVRGTCDNQRNLSDEQLRAIAANGGLVGIGFWDTATCGTDALAIAKAIRHASTVMGVKHVALGSDFDGAIKAPFDAGGVAMITEALINEGFSDEEIAAIMGGNTVRFLRENMPD